MNGLLSSPQCILVTGANGFIGSHVVDELLKGGHQVKAVLRSKWSNAPQGVEIIYADLSAPIDWSTALNGVTTIIHLVARVHQMNESCLMALDEFRNLNTRATIELAEQAAKAGVERFIFLSTIAINGAFTEPGQFFTESSEPNPQNSYAISKYEAELGLVKITKQFPMEVVIIRPPMVYGEKAPGNFSRLVELIKTGIPLPFGRARQPRSFIFIQNLVDFILLSIHHPSAGNELFLISDGDDITLSNLISKISYKLRMRRGIFPVPLFLLDGLLRVLGQNALLNQLIKPMRISIAKAHTVMGWRAPYSADAALNLSVKKCESC